MLQMIMGVKMVVEISKEPIAFFSYVQNDDKHDSGRISLIRERLEGELRMLTGKPFKIFQDRNDIAWGQQWEGRINEAINDVIFLIPIVTPTYFESVACRSEYTKFLLRERVLGEDRLIFPIYYVDCDKISDAILRKGDEIADSISERQWTDWRLLRFKEISDNEVSKTIFDMASTIKKSMSELASVIQAARKAEKPRKRAIAEKDARAKTSKSLTIAQHSHTIPFTIDDFNVPSLFEEGTELQIGEAIKNETYFAFTKQYDEIVTPTELSDAETTARVGGFVRPVINKLRASIKISSDSRSRALRSIKDLSVTLLIDNSGSLRGRNIINCAAWCVIVTEELAQAGIPLEILGYTTRAWKGGLSREFWLKNGMPKRPGRLNDLRHIIYKSFGQSQTDATANLYLMCRETLLKENIDGEALIWALQRAQEHPAKDHLILVLSDGAPVDDSTLSVNPGNFLEKHLREVIDKIGKISNCILFGVGIEHDIDRYYPNSSTVDDLNLLGSAIFDAISKSKASP